MAATNHKERIRQAQFAERWRQEQSSKPYFPLVCDDEDMEKRRTTKQMEERALGQRERASGMRKNARDMQETALDMSPRRRKASKSKKKSSKRT